MTKFNFGTLTKKSEIVPDKENISDSQETKITPGEKDQKIEPPQHKIRDATNLTPKKPEILGAQSIDVNTIDNKINETINDRILKLVKIGLKHELTIENMMQYFREVERGKLYELRRYFSDSPGYKIEKVLKFLYVSGELKKDKDNWYSLK